MFGATALVLAASLLAGDTSAEKALQEWGNYFVAGVWTTTNAQGTKEECRYEWILDKSFIRLSWKIGEESRQEIHGIDPATSRWACWGFDSKGRVWKGGAESAKAGEWIFHGSGQGKAGPNSWKDKTVKLGADKRRVEVLENILDGKKLPPEVQIWTRKK